MSSLLDIAKKWPCGPLETPDENHLFSDAELINSFRAGDQPELKDVVCRVRQRLEDDLRYYAEHRAAVAASPCQEDSDHLLRQSARSDFRNNTGKRVELYGKRTKVIQEYLQELSGLEQSA